jgi:hypothetical protein
MERNTADREDAQEGGENLSSVQAEDARRREVERLQAEQPDRFGQVGRRAEGEELLDPDRRD